MIPCMFILVGGIIGIVFNHEILFLLIGLMLGIFNDINLSKKKED